MIVKNRLLNFGDNVIYQDNDYFNFSLDSVLLANFVKFSKDDKNILDMCTGNAPIPMLLSFKTDINIIGIELQKEIYDLGVKSITHNKFDKQITLINDDVKNLSNYYSCEFFDIITCNPPYFKFESSDFVNSNDIKSIARHEIKINLKEIIELSSKFLKNKGQFCLIHRPERLTEIFKLMNLCKLEPKEIRFVYSKSSNNSNMVLIRAIKNGNNGLKVLPPLIAHCKDGSYSKEIKEMFGD